MTNAARRPTRPTVGLVVLQEDETVEEEMRRLLPDPLRLMVSRVPSGVAVTPESLSEMAAHLGRAAALFPRGLDFDALGYACTSGAAEIGSDRVAEILSGVVSARGVTDPAAALIAACRQAGLDRLALLSPYIPEVSGQLRDVLDRAGIATPEVATFDEAEEARVARIAPETVVEAGLDLMDGADVGALFISCTNLRTEGVLAEVARRTGRPVWSSNLVLAWSLARIAGVIPPTDTPDALLRQ